MKKTMTLTVLAAIAILGFATNNTFAFGGNRGGGFRHQESRQESRRDSYRDYRRDYRREIVVVRPCREPVYVCPPRAGIIISPFIIIGF